MDPFPAGAGITRICVIIPGIGIAVPRRRGDNPVESRQVDTPYGRSPQARG